MTWYGRWLLAGAVVVLVTLWGAAEAEAHPGSGILVDDDGRVTFVDMMRHRVLRLDTDGSVEVLVSQDDFEDFEVPHHLSPDGSGGFYVAAHQDGLLLHVDADGEVRRAHPPDDWHGWAHLGTGGDPFAVHPDGRIVTLHSRSPHYAQVVRLGADGGIEQVIGRGVGHRDGPADEARFTALHGGGFALRDDGTLVLTDAGRWVREVAPDGTVTTLAGGDERGFADGPAADARFEGASGVAIEADGSILVADVYNHRIRRVAPDGTVTTVAGDGERDDDDGPVAQASFTEPWGVAAGPGGAIYVLDWDSETPVVRVIRDGRVETLHRAQ